MSDTLNTHRISARQKFLATASILALLGSGAGSAIAAGSEADRPPLWIELGWQYSRLNGHDELFNPPMFSELEQAGFVSPAAEYPLLYSYGANGKITFQPDGSDWMFSASINIGRAHGRRDQRYQSDLAQSPIYTAYSRKPVFGFYHTIAQHRTVARFADAETTRQESHAIVDFTAGRDVGIGLFGSQSTSSISAGVRFAQFKSKSATRLAGDSDSIMSPQYVTFTTYYNYNYYNSQPLHQDVTFYFKFNKRIWHHSTASISARRNFQGIGPMLSWNASSLLVGDVEDGGLSFDWSVNAALLFGRQKAVTHHETVRYYKSHNLLYHHVYDHDVMRKVVVPNLGGTMGLTYHIQDFKLSLGYRADFFFGAMDGGIDTRKSEDRGFFGPYASISVGLGD